MQLISKVVFATLITIASAGPIVNQQIFLKLDFLPPPPEIPIEAQNEYSEILSNTTQTLKELEDNTRLWAEKHGISEQLEKYNSKINEVVEQFKMKYTSVGKNLEYIEKQYTELYQNETLTISEMSQSVEKLNEQYPLEFKILGYVFDEILTDFKNNSNLGENEKVLEVIQSNQEVMNAMRMLTKR